MAEGRSNAGIGRRPRVTEGTVEKHVRSILDKLALQEDTDDDHRRVPAVLTFPESRRRCRSVVHRPAALSAPASRV